MTKHILTTIALLLSLFTYTAAQNRSAKENLEGLREIGVIVKYGNSEGLAAAMQPTILQMLQDRAVDQLRHAEIPLLQPKEGTELVNRARLVLTVIVNKPTDTAPTIRVETRLYEKVRLSRDSSKEMSLATWAHGGVGIAKKVSHEMLFSVFDTQLNQFIRDYWEVNTKPTQRVTVTSDPPTQVNNNANSLQGIKSIRLFVTFRPSMFPHSVQRQEFQERLQEEARAKLIDAGIPVPRYRSDPPDPLLLRVVITLGDQPNLRSHAPPIVIESGLWQEIRHLRDLRKQTLAVTWESEMSDGGPITDDAVRKAMDRQLDEFIKAYRAANPMPSVTMIEDELVSRVTNWSPDKNSQHFLNKTFRTS